MCFIKALVYHIYWRYRSNSMRPFHCSDPFADYLTTPEHVTTISGEKCVSGLTIIDYKLYVIHFESPDLSIYHTEPTIRPYRRVPLTALEPQDLTSCSTNRCLYVCDWNTCHVLRLELNGTELIHWKLKDKPGGLSVNGRMNVLVSCPGTRQIFEYSPEGSQVRVIQLPKDLDKPWHAVQLGSSTRLAVSCWHRICIVEETGTPVQTHGSTAGSALTHVNSPSHLALDGNDVIVVADTNNDRLKLLGAAMECRELNAGSQAVAAASATTTKGPRRLLFDRMTRLLYIGLISGNILVYRIVI